MFPRQQVVVELRLEGTVSLVVRQQEEQARQLFNLLETGLRQLGEIHL